MARRLKIKGLRPPSQAAAEELHRPPLKSGVEVVDHVLESILPRYNQAQELFHHYDQHGRGSIRKSEFRAVLTKMGLKMTNRQFNALAQAYDRNNSGRISYREFIRAVAKTVIPAPSGHLKVKSLSRLQASADEAAGSGRRQSATMHTSAPLPFQSSDAAATSGAGRTLRHRSRGSNDKPTITKWVETRFAKRAVSDTTALAKAFRRFDSKSSGTVTVPQFRTALKRVGVKVSDAELRLLVSAVHGNGNSQRNQRRTASRSGGGTTGTAKASAGPTSVSLRQFSSLIARHFTAKAQDVSLVDLSEELAAHEPNRRQESDKALRAAELMLENKLFHNYRRVQDAFRAFDEDKSGSISHEEFRHTLEHLGLDMSNAMFAKFVKMYDPENTGTIDYARFNHNVGSMIHPRDTGFMVARPHESHNGRPGTADVVRNIERKFAQNALRGMRSVDNAFHKLDADHSGTVTTGEFVEALRHNGIQLKDDMYANLVNKYDPHGTGKVSIAQFRRNFHSVLKASADKAAGATAAAAAARQHAPVPRTKSTALQAHNILANKLASKFAKVQHAFLVFDTNRDGSISRDEFRKALLSFGIEMSDRQFRDFCVAYDPHMTGRISYTQFNNQVGELIQPTNHGLVVRRLGKQKKRPRNAAVTAAGVTVASWVEEKFAKRAVQRLQTVAEVFDSLDTDGSGYLSFAEFGQALRKFGVGLGHEAVAAVADLYDVDGDGKISLEEFTNRLTSTIANSLGGKLAKAKILSRRDTERRKAAASPQRRVYMRKRATAAAAASNVNATALASSPSPKPLVRPQTAGSVRSTARPRTPAFAGIARPMSAHAGARSSNGGGDVGFRPTGTQQQQQQRQQEEQGQEQAWPRDDKADAVSESDMWEARSQSNDTAAAAAETMVPAVQVSMLADEPSSDTGAWHEERHGEWLGEQPGRTVGGAGVAAARSKRRPASAGATRQRSQRVVAARQARPQSAYSAVSVSSVLSDVGQAEHHTSSAVAGRWKRVFRAFRTYDKLRTKHVPVRVFHSILARYGAALGRDEMTGVMDKYATGSRVNYVAFMRNMYLHNHSPPTLMSRSHSTMGTTRLPLTTTAAGSSWTMQQSGAVVDDAVKSHVRRDWKNVKRELSKAAKMEGSRRSLSMAGFGRAMRRTGVRIGGSQATAIQRAHPSGDGGIDFFAFLRETLARPLSHSHSSPVALAPSLMSPIRT